tara:strand:+ start:496 stop:666 length:171 start_codon:yes stop_codon:yes gene_type:complete
MILILAKISVGFKILEWDFHNREDKIKEMGHFKWVVSHLKEQNKYLMIFSKMGIFN